MDNSLLYMQCLSVAADFIEKGYPIGEVTLEQLADTLYKLEIEKIEKNTLSDSTLQYDDEILEIEEIGDMETIDISVSGDNLFYCNGILTKNSFGLPMTLDLMIALVTSDELKSLNQMMFKQLKNRDNDLNYYNKFFLGIDSPKMRLYELEDSAQESIPKERDEPVMDNTNFGMEDKFENASKKKKNFSGFIE